ncbi:MAG: sigma-70 family RNA polymerase sigma factor [Hyphomicrobiales bacterium]|nr:sigma-70 family RNA polymerase sigma factor [Hyphomicrobiales bacterium]
MTDRFFLKRPETANKAKMPDLISRIARDQDPQAFQELFLKYGPRVKAMMMRQGADAETAEEIAQDTMLAVWRKAHLFAENKGSVSTWVFTIARNLRIDRLRRQVVWQDLEPELDTLVSEDDQPDVAVSRAELVARMRAALDTLPPEQYEVVQLSYVDGLSHHEISERVNAPLGTVKSRIRLAYQKIRDAVGDDL